MRMRNVTAFFQAEGLMLLTLPSSGYYLGVWRKRRMVAGVLFILTVGGIALAVFSSRKAIRLSDGTQMISVTADFGTNHPYTMRESRLGLALRPLFPTSVLRLVSRPRKEVGVQSSQEILVITLLTSSPERRSHPRGILNLRGLQAQLVDEHGCVFAVSGTSTFDNGIERACQFQFPDFPRRAAKLNVLVTSSGSPTETIQFKVANPLGPKPAPRWQADALPASRTVGDLTFTLESAKAISGDGRWFQLTRNGRFVDDWTGVDFQIEDSHGNLGRPRCLCEPACRVRALAWPNGNARFENSNVFLILETKLPPGGSIAELRTNCVVNGLKLKLVALAAPGVYSISNKMVVASAPLPPDASQGYTFTGFKRAGGLYIETGLATWTRYRFLFKPFSLPPKQKLLFRTRNERGQVGMLSGPKEGESLNVWKCFDLEVAPNSHTVLIEGILAEPRVAEFYIASAAFTNSAAAR
jgi:hypothetical protein